MTNKADRFEPELTQLNETVAETVAYYRNLAKTQPPRARVGGPWGPRETLAHLVFWHEWSNENLEAALAGQPLRPISKSIDELNADAVAKYASLDLDTLATRLENLQQKLVEGYRQLGDPNTAVAARRSGAGIGAKERLGLIADHLKSHLPQVSS